MSCSCGEFDESASETSSVRGLRSEGVSERQLNDARIGRGPGDSAERRTRGRVGCCRIAIAQKSIRIYKLGCIRQIQKLRAEANTVRLDRKSTRLNSSHRCIS